MATSVNFDKNSTEILKRIEPIHRESLINLGLALISKTGYYKTLTGDISETLENVTSLDNLEQELNTTVVKNKDPIKVEISPASSWDDF